MIYRDLTLWIRTRNVLLAREGAGCRKVAPASRERLSLDFPVRTTVRTGVDWGSCPGERDAGRLLVAGPGGVPSVGDHPSGFVLGGCLSWVCFLLVVDRPGFWGVDKPVGDGKVEGLPRRGPGSGF